MEGTTSSSELGVVIVGVDGSEPARRAALWQRRRPRAA